MNNDQTSQPDRPKLNWNVGRSRIEYDFCVPEPHPDDGMMDLPGLSTTGKPRHGEPGQAEWQQVADSLAQTVTAFTDVMGPVVDVLLSIEAKLRVDRYTALADQSTGRKRRRMLRNARRAQVELAAIQTRIDKRGAE